MENMQPGSGAQEEMLGELLMIGASLLFGDSMGGHDLRDAASCNRLSETLSSALQLDILPAHDLYSGEYVDERQLSEASDHTAKLYVRCAQVYQVVAQGINPVFVFKTGMGNVLEKTIEELNREGFPPDADLTTVRAGDPCLSHRPDLAVRGGILPLPGLPDATGMLGGPGYVRTMLLDTYDPVQEAFTGMTPGNTERHNMFRERLSAARNEHSGENVGGEAGSKTLLKYKKRVDKLRRKMGVHQEELLSVLGRVFSTIRITEDGKETITINDKLGGDIRQLSFEQWLENAERTLDKEIVPAARKSLKGLYGACDKEMKELAKIHQAIVAELEIRRLRGQIQSLEVLDSRRYTAPSSFFLGV